MHKIAITGPESSGKTSLTIALANHFDCAFTEEYSREYLEFRNGKYDQDDLLAILKGQMRLEEKAINKEDTLLICDTDPLVIWIWSMVKYGHVHEEIEKTLISQHYDLFLLVKPDIKWVADPLRESKNDRDKLFTIYKAKLEEYNKPYVIIDGNKIERLDKAINVINSIV